jgi:solute:Na+ symporter, SSS family
LPITDHLAGVSPHQAIRNSKEPAMTTFAPLDFAVMLIYLAAMLGVGLRFARRQRATETYFLADRAMPWTPVALSLYASLTSATTYLVLPAKAYFENIAIIVAGGTSLLVAPFLIFLFYPVYRRLRVTTSYEYLGIRFGCRARWAASVLFVMARLSWMGLVIYAPSLALSVMTAWPLWGCILLMGLLATGYTALGGLTAVLWTDVIQFVILVGGAIWVAVTLGAGVSGGPSAILAHAADQGRLAVFGWRPSLTSTTWISAGLYFFLQMMQDYGTDQVGVQRLMAVRTDRGVVKALAFNAVTDLVMISLLLFIGLGLLAYFDQQAIVPAIAKNDQILPYFILHHLPAGVAGLLITAILAAAMSSMDSGINSLATVITSDIVRPLRPEWPDAAALRLARWLTLGLGLAATALAFAVQQFDDILDAFSTFMGLFNAPVLALFLLGLLTRRGRFGAWLISLAVALPLAWFLRPTMDWSWRFPVSFAICFLPAWALSLLDRRPAPSMPSNQ